MMSIEMVAHQNEEDDFFIFFYCQDQIWVIFFATKQAQRFNRVLHN